MVSSLTNHGVQEAFRALIQDIHSCNILNKEILDEEKRKGKEGEVEDDLLSLEDASAVITHTITICTFRISEAAFSQVESPKQLEGESDRRLNHLKEAYFSSCLSSTVTQLEMTFT